MVRVELIKKLPYSIVLVRYIPCNVCHGIA